jgi:LuxR family maltose regulon positive regulatory protein
MAWLSVDEADNDPPRFWRYVLAALQEAGVPISPALPASLQSPPPAIHPWFVTWLNSLAAFPTTWYSCSTLPPDQAAEVHKIPTSC